MSHTNNNNHNPHDITTFEACLLFSFMILFGIIISAAVASGQVVYQDGDNCHNQQFNTMGYHDENAYIYHHQQQQQHAQQVFNYYAQQHHQQHHQQQQMNTMQFGGVSATSVTDRHMNGAHDLTSNQADQRRERLLKYRNFEQNNPYANIAMFNGRFNS
eukprot:UN02752